MNLRSRLLLGYGYLVALLVLAGVGAALSFHHLGRSIDRILRENFRSVTSAMGMLESLERQDSATLATLLRHETAAAALAESERMFLHHLADAARNVTVAGEEEILAEIGHRFERYVESRDTLLAAELDRPLEAYERDAFPAFLAVKASVFELLTKNQQAMVAADSDARAVAGASSLALAGLVGVALLSLGLLSRNLQRDVLSRLEDVKVAAEAIRHGDRDVRVRVRQDDELGMLARELNRALDGAEDLEGRMMGRLAHQRQIVLGLLAAMEIPAAVVGLDGRLVASTMDEGPTAAVAESGSLLHQLSRMELMDWEGGGSLARFEVGLAGGRQFTARLLVAPRSRPVGWLLTPQ